MSKTINLGRVTAYADAVAAGYTGTREQFANDLANAANYAAEAGDAAETATNKAEEASTAAETATGAAEEASADAEQAHADAQAILGAKETAVAAAATATSKAGEAANSASAAANSETAAAGSATTASNAATSATASKNAAATSETNAANSANAAAQTLTNVNQAGAAQVAAIQAKGTEVLNSIPADYTELSNDIDDLKSDLIQIAKPSGKNLFDEKKLLKDGITFSDGVYSGSGSAFADDFGANTDGLTVFGGFEPNTQYTLSCKVRNTSDTGLTGHGLYLYVLYTDSTSERTIIYRSYEDFTDIAIVSAENKTISKYYFAVAQSPTIIWAIKDLQIEKGTTASIYEPFDLTAVDDGVDVLNEAVDTGIILVTKNITWKNGYVNGAGLIKSSTVAQFGLVTLHQWETVTVGTRNTNICIIGSTESNSVAVGDTVTVVQKTSTIDQYEEYTFTNTNAADINIVISVSKSDYNLSFIKDTAIKRNRDEIVKIKNDIDVINNGLYTGRVSVQKDLVLKSGFVDRSGRVRTSQVSAFCLVQLSAGESVFVTTSSDSVAVISETTATDVSVGDNVTPLVTVGTGGISAIYSYTALYNINLVLCFVRDDYSVTFYRDTYAYQYGETLEFSIRGASTPPSYYLSNNYLKNKVARINALGKTADDVFTFITDIHWELNAKHSPDLLAYIGDRCVIRKLFDGGDVADRGISLSDDTMIDVYKRYRKASGSYVYHLTGNHDWFTPSDGKVLYYGMDSENNDQIGNPFMHYYYFDNVQQKIRYIVLNPFSREAESTTLTVLYDTNQINWFTNIALDLPAEDWDVLVFTHFLRTTTVVASGEYIESAIATFNADASHSGKVLAVFQGHAHWDGVYHTTSGVPVITTTCDKWDLSNESALIPSEGIAFRELGTKSEQAFDVMVLNRASQTITAVRIGALAQDNVDKYRTDTGFTWIGTLEERVISYANN